MLKEEKVQTPAWRIIAGELLFQATIYAKILFFAVSSVSVSEQM
jgi:hypothetical protein